MEKLYPNAYYHILNRANGNDVLFKEAENYFFFLEKYKKHLHPVVETLAYALLGNHFHLVVRVRTVDEIEKTLPGFETLEELAQTNKISRQFSHCFNSYAQAFNKKYNRSGSLFQKNFKRQSLDNSTYLKNAITYVHTNPVHHGFCRRIADWPFTSYLSLLSTKPTLLSRNHVIDLFEGLNQFKSYTEEFEEQKCLALADKLEEA